MLKGHQSDHRLAVAMLLCRQHRRPDLVQIRHGLNEDQIRLLPRIHLFGVKIIRLLKGQRAGRLQHLPGGAQIQRHQGFPRRSPSCALNGSRDHLLHRGTAACQLCPVCPEGVGADDIGASLYIGTLHLLHQRRILQIQQLRPLSCLHAVCLEHGTHASVKKYIIVL